MQPIMEDFDSRVEEIEKFFRLMTLFESSGLEVSRLDSIGRRRHVQVDTDYLIILKASAFLLLYNLVESAIREGIGAIYEQIERDGCSLGSVKENVRQLWLEQQYKALDLFSAAPRTFLEHMQALVERVVGGATLQLDKTRLPVSGNLDADAVRAVCNRHGISPKAHKAAGGAPDLRTVKVQRNALAHGNSSFVEVGRQYTVPQLEDFKKQTVIFVRSILRNFNTYANGRRYAL